MHRKALIVSGAAGPQDVANSVLQRFGFAPAVSALSVTDAAGRLRTEKYDLIVIPLQGLDQHELNALEREVRRYPGTCIIGTAAQSDPELILRAMRSGVNEFLLYPPEATDLATAIDRLTRRSHVDSKAGMTIAVYSAKGGLGTTSGSGLHNRVRLPSGFPSLARAWPVRLPPRPGRGRRIPSRSRR